MKSRPTIARSLHARRGFTLVEIMVVVVIIGVLAMLAFPAFAGSRRNAQSAHFINDLRLARAVFEAHALENGFYPAESTPGVVPSGMTDALSRIKWDEPTSIGGQWDWDNMQYGFVAGVSVFAPTAPASQMAKIDARIDDGNLSTGMFRQHASGYIYIIE